MTKSSLYLNAIRDSFVKYLDKENLKNFCISKSKNFPDTSFTRNRVFSLPVLVGFILSPRVKSLVIDTADYLHGLNLEIASGAAFSKRRTRIPADYIHQMHYGLVSNIYSKGLAPARWHGHLLLAADGTTYSLPDTEPMAEKFLAGRKTGKTNQPLARGVVIKDVLNDIVIDANMECYGDDEIKLSLKLLKKLPKVVRDLSPVVIFDRKYCAYTLIDKLISLNIDFIIRVKSKFNEQVDAFMESDAKEAIVTLKPAAATLKKLKKLHGSNANEFKVRLVRESDNVVVMTSLMSDENVLSDTILTADQDSTGATNKEISENDKYRLRWTDETTIGFLKNNLQVEIFSSTKTDNLYQDFYSKLINYNIVTLVAMAAAEARQPRKQDTKHKLGINRNDTLGLISIMFWKSLILDNLNDTWDKLLKQVARHTCAIIPDRHNPRVFRKIKHNGKFITLTNYKTAI